MRLRDETAELHALVDELGSRVASVSDPVGYRTFLLAMARVTAEFAELLDRSSETAGLPPRSDMLLRALVADLHALDVVVRFEEPPAGPEASAPDVATDAAAWGVGYVLEGSALGAAVLLAEIDGSPDERPTAYLSLLVEARAGRWPGFVEGLNAADLDEPAGDLAVDAARRVFRFVEAALVESSVAVVRP